MLISGKGAMKDKTVEGKRKWGERGRYKRCKRKRVKSWRKVLMSFSREYFHLSRFLYSLDRKRAARKIIYSDKNLASLSLLVCF